MEELHGVLGLRGRSAREMTLEQLTEAVRRVMAFKYVQIPRVTKRYWSMDQAHDVGMSGAGGRDACPVGVGEPICESAELEDVALALL